MKSLCSILLSLCCFAAFSQTIGEYNGKKILEGVVIYKYATAQLKHGESSAQLARREVDEYLQAIGATPPEQKFPMATIPDNCENCVDISSIYTCQIPPKTSLDKVLAKLNKMDGVEYAEPSYVGDLFLTPNDSEYGKGNLWHLNTCNVLNAWDVEEGDSSVVVAVVDCGIDIIHKDLINKIAYNLDDPINGKDDDGDGYVDNYRGWDLADNDNNPVNSNGIEHGTYVAGIVTAEVNNEFGTAGVGYKTRMLPLKVCPQGQSVVTSGYDGIAYAANQGCKVINCSWGDPGGSKYGQDIVDYATFNCNALVVAAAGNSAATELYFPASYDNVLSVGGTIVGDYVWADSNVKGSQYNHSVDICAPAKGFYSLANDGKTFPMSGGGTSFAAPIVSGAAALVRSKYPEFSAVQVGEILRITADDIYTLNNEPKYKNMLGHGRLNVYNALTNDSIPSIRIIDYSLKNNTNQPFTYVKDTLFLHLTLKNQLFTAKNVAITASCENSILAPVETDTAFAEIVAGGEVECTFAFRVLITPPVNYDLQFKLLTIADNSYSDYEYISFPGNKQYYDFSVGDIQSTATNDGSIAVYSTKLEQNGFIYKNYDNCIFQAGVFIAENQNNIYVRNDKRADFTALIYPTIHETDSCDVVISSQYSAENLVVDQIIYGWDDVDALIYDFVLSNERDSTLYDVRLGTFIDWDIMDSKYNNIWYVDSLQLTVAASVSPSTLYVGCMPLDYHESGVYAFNVANDIVYYNDGFNNTELWYVVTHSQKEAGTNSVYGSEVAVFNYSKIDTLEVGNSSRVRYAMLAAETPKELYDVAYRLKQTYNPNILVPDTTEIVAVESCSLSPVQAYVRNGELYVVYQQSDEPVSIQLLGLDGKRFSAVSLAPEYQTGVYSVQIPETGVLIVSVKQNGLTYTFKFVQ